MNRNSSHAGVAETTLADSNPSAGEARLSDFGLFFRKFLAKGRDISSAIPSSRAMGECVLAPIDFNRPATIIELGAGTGPITEMIVERIRPHHRFVAVENDPDFCDVLRRRFPETTLLQADASRIEGPLSNLGIEKVDYVLSGLPTPNLPPRAQVKLMQWLRKCLSPAGIFVQITVAPLVYRRFYSRVFHSVQYRMVWLNLPPGGVYYCSRPK